VTDDVTDGQALPVPEANNDASLDELLGEFNEPQTPERAKPQGDELSRVVEFVDDMAAKESQREFNEAVGTAVESIKKDEAAAKYPDRMIRGHLNALADENPQFRDAFQNRTKNPNAWKKSLEWAGKEFHKDISSLPDDQITSDLEAAQASVRGISNEAPDAPKRKTSAELTSMGDAEFQAYKAGL
jgi:hypothetical protein